MDPNIKNINRGDLSNDILFLEKRLIALIHSEEYEKAAIVLRWIKELTERNN